MKNIKNKSVIASPVELSSTGCGNPDEIASLRSQ
jgi:hypothetical protein